MTDRLRPRRLRRPAGIVAAAAALLMTLTGCWSSGAPAGYHGAIAPTAGPTATSAVPAGLERYYTQAVAWTDCGDGFECAEVVAPMNWDAPDPATDIRLAAVRLPASGDKIGSLFINPGGPGASGFDTVRYGAEFATGDPLRERFDVVGWDPRGVGRSAPVICFPDPKDMDDFLFGIPEADPKADPQGWIDEVTASAIEVGKACAEHTGEVLQYIDTISTVRDLDLLRAVVGDPKLYYLGYSYGSDIGAYYLDLFPQNAGRVVLDGATDPAIPVFEVGLEQTKGFQLALENYLAACPEMFRSSCPFTGDVPADLAVIQGLIARYDAAPVPGADGRMMDGGVLITAIKATLYSQDFWEYLNDVFWDAQEGRTEWPFILADYYYDRGEDGSYSTNMFEAFFAIYCVDYPVEDDPAEWARQEALFKQASPTFYREFPIMGDVLCENWPYKYLGDGDTSVTGAGAPPFLVIATTGDPATPYEWGVRVARAMPSAQLITYNGEGHTAYGKSQCVDVVVEAYFIRGTVPASDPNCS